MPVIRVRRPMIGILHWCALLYPPFPKEHACDRVAWAAMHRKQAWRLPGRR